MGEIFIIHYVPLSQKSWINLN